MAYDTYIPIYGGETLVWYSGVESGSVPAPARVPLNMTASGPSAEAASVAGVSSDGTRAFFTSADPNLIIDPTDGTSATVGLTGTHSRPFVYDATTGQIQPLLSVDPDAATSVSAVLPDGRVVLTTSATNLNPSPQPSASPFVVIWEGGAAFTLVSETTDRDGDPIEKDWGHASTGASDDGNRVVFHARSLWGSDGGVFLWERGLGVSVVHEGDRASANAGMSPNGAWVSVAYRSTGGTYLYDIRNIDTGNRQELGSASLWDISGGPGGLSAALYQDGTAFKVRWLLGGCPTLYIEVDNAAAGSLAYGTAEPFEACSDDPIEPNVRVENTSGLWLTVTWDGVPAVSFDDFTGSHMIPPEGSAAWSACFDEAGASFTAVADLTTPDAFHMNVRQALWSAISPQYVSLLWSWQNWQRFQQTLAGMPKMLAALECAAHIRPGPASALDVACAVMNVWASLADSDERGQLVEAFRDIAPEVPIVAWALDEVRLQEAIVQLGFQAAVLRATYDATPWWRLQEKLRVLGQLLAKEWELLQKEFEARVLYPARLLPVVGAVVDMFLVLIEHNMRLIIDPVDTVRFVARES